MKYSYIESLQHKLVNISFSTAIPTQYCFVISNAAATIGELKKENNKYRQAMYRINKFIKRNEYFDYRYNGMALSLSAKELAELKDILSEVERDN